MLALEATYSKVNVTQIRQGLSDEEQGKVFGFIKNNLMESVQQMTEDLLGKPTEDISEEEFRPKYDQVVEFIKQNL